MEQGRIGTVGALRGIAALAVCWFHFTFGQTPWMKASGKYGWLGVPVFFVISGFIIPYSLYQRRYKLEHFGTFIAKRMLRLYPPYVAAIAVALLLPYFWEWLPRTHTLAPPFIGKDIFFNLTYLSDLVKRPWINVVYWTLAIEVQWYLLLGIGFPLIASRKIWTQLTGIAISVALFAAVRHERLVFHFIPMFLIGVFVFQYSLGLMGRARLFLFLAAGFALLWRFHGQPVAYAALATGITIAFCSIENQVLNKLGDISYSVYLLHIPVGLKILTSIARLPYSGSYMALVDLVSISCVIYASYYFYRWFEEPSQRLSSRIAFGEKRLTQLAPLEQPLNEEILANNPA